MRREAQLELLLLKASSLSSLWRMTMMIWNDDADYIYMGKMRQMKFYYIVSNLCDPVDDK